MTRDELYKKYNLSVNDKVERSTRFQKEQEYIWEQVLTKIEEAAKNKEYNVYISASDLKYDEDLFEGYNVLMMLMPGILPIFDGILAKRLKELGYTVKKAVYGVYTAVEIRW